MNKIKYESLNTLKGLACIGVVFMHCSFPGILGKIISYCFKFNVPIFFMISGFFLYSLDNNQIINRIKKQISKIAKMMLFCFVFYGLFDFIVKCYIDNSILKEKWIIDTFNISELPRKLLFGTFFNGTLWYLYALIWSYILLLLFFNYSKYSKLLFSVPIIFIIHIVTRIYVKYHNFDWYFANYWRSCFLYGIPFILLGFIIANNKNSLVKINNKILCIVAVLGLLLQFVEYYLFKQSLDFYFGSIFYSISLFILAIKYPLLKYNDTINYIGEKLSMYIYIIHFSIIIFLSHIYSISGFSPYLRPILAVLISILIAQIYIYFKRIVIIKFSK
jgi:peptidoglycan/LPS O-acetylase OafA/YrhL